MGEDAQPQLPKGGNQEVRPPGADEAAADVTRDTKAFISLARNRIFSFLRGLVNEDYEQALTYLSSPNDPDGQPWTPARLVEVIDAYHAEHERICLDPNARNLRHTYVLPSEDKKSWRVQQMLVDPEEHNDWVAEFEIDLAESRKSAEPVLRLRRIGGLV